MDRHMSDTWLKPEKDFISQLASKLKILQFKQWNRWNIKNTTKPNSMLLQRRIGPQQWKNICKPTTPANITKETLKEKAVRHGFEPNIAFQEQEKHQYNVKPKSKNIPEIQMMITLTNNNKLKNTFNLKADIASKFVLELEKTLASMVGLKSDVVCQENAPNFKISQCMQENIKIGKSPHLKNILNTYQEAETRSPSKAEESSGSGIPSSSKGHLRKESTFGNNREMDSRKAQECEPELYLKHMCGSNNNTEGAEAKYGGRILIDGKTSIDGKSIVSGITLIRDKIKDKGKTMSNEETELEDRPNPEKTKINGGEMLSKEIPKTAFGNKTELHNMYRHIFKTESASTSAARSKITSNSEAYGKCSLQDKIAFGSTVKARVDGKTTPLGKTMHCTNSSQGSKTIPNSKSIHNDKTTARGIKITFACKPGQGSETTIGYKTRFRSPGNAATGRAKSAFGNTSAERESKVKLQEKGATGRKITIKCKPGDKYKTSVAGYIPVDSKTTAGCNIAISGTPIAKTTLGHSVASRDKSTSRDKTKFSGQVTSEDKSSPKYKTAFGHPLIPEGKLMSKSKITAGSNDTISNRTVGGNSICSNNKSSIVYTTPTPTPTPTPTCDKTNPKRNSVKVAFQMKQNVIRKENTFQRNEKSSNNISTTANSSEALEVSDVNDTVGRENSLKRNDEPTKNTETVHVSLSNPSETLETKHVSYIVRSDNTLERNDKHLKNLNATCATPGNSKNDLAVNKFNDLVRGENTFPLPLKKVNNKQDAPIDSSEVLEENNVNDVMNRLRPKYRNESKLWLVHMKPLLRGNPYTHKYLIIPLVSCQQDKKSMSQNENDANSKRTYNFTSMKSPNKAASNSCIKTKVGIKKKKAVNFTSASTMEITPRPKYTSPQRISSKLKYVHPKMAGGKTKDSKLKMQSVEKRNSGQQINKEKSQSSIKQDKVNNMKYKQETYKELRNFQRQTNVIKSDHLVESNKAFRKENEYATEFSLEKNYTLEEVPRQTNKNFLKSEEVPNEICAKEKAIELKEQQLEWKFWQEKKNEEYNLQKIRDFLQSNTFMNSTLISEKVKAFLARYNSASREDIYKPEHRNEKNIPNQSAILTEIDKPPELTKVLKTSSQCSSINSGKDNVSVKPSSPSIPEIDPKIRNSVNKIMNQSNSKRKVLLKDNFNLKNAPNERNKKNILWTNITGGRKKILPSHNIREPAMASQTKGDLKFKQNLKLSKIQEAGIIEQKNKNIPDKKKELKSKNFLKSRFSHGPSQLQDKNLSRYNVLAKKKWKQCKNTVPKSNINTVNFHCQRMTDLPKSMFDAYPSRERFPRTFTIAIDNVFKLNDIFNSRNTPETLLTCEQNNILRSMTTNKERKLVMPNNVLKVIMAFDSLDSKNLFKSNEQFHRNVLQKTKVADEFESETLKYVYEKKWMQNTQSPLNLTQSYELVDKLGPKITLKTPNFVRCKTILHRKSFSVPQITKTKQYLSKINNITEENEICKRKFTHKMDQIKAPKDIQRRKTVSGLQTINNIKLIPKLENNFKAKNVLEQYQPSKKTCLAENAQKQVVSFKSNARLKSKVDANSSNICKPMPLRKYGLLFEPQITSTLEPETEVKLNITTMAGNKFPPKFTPQNKLMSHNLRTLNNLQESTNKLGKMNSFGTNFMSNVKRKVEPNINFQGIKEATAMCKINDTTTFSKPEESENKRHSLFKSASHINSKLVNSNATFELVQSSDSAEFNETLAIGQSNVMQKSLIESVESCIVNESMKSNEIRSAKSNERYNSVESYDKLQSETPKYLQESREVTDLPGLVKSNDIHASVISSNIHRTSCTNCKHSYLTSNIMPELTASNNIHGPEALCNMDCCSIKFKT